MTTASIVIFKDHIGCFLFTSSVLAARELRAKCRARRAYYLSFLTLLCSFLTQMHVNVFILIIFLYLYFSCENSYFLKYASLYTIVLQVPALLTLISQTSAQSAEDQGSYLMLLSFS